MTGLVEQTVRRLDGDDILAVVVRENRVIVVADSTVDPRCDPASVTLAGIRGQIVLPLVSDDVVGTLQVAARSLDASHLDLRPLETLATHTARALTGLSATRGDPPAEPDARSSMRRSWLVPRPRSANRPGSCESVLDCMGDGVVVADSQAQVPGLQPGRRANPGSRADRRAAPGLVASLRGLFAGSDDPLSRSRTFL